MVADLELARRLDRAEAEAGARYVETRAAHWPESGVHWAEIDGAYALYDGPESPVTQCFCLGLFREPTEASLSRIESFFTALGAPVMHDVSPLADKALWPLIGARGYVPIEFTSVMYLPLEGRLPRAQSPGLQTRSIKPGEADLWARIATEGWGAGQLYDVMRAFARRPDSPSFLAEIAGEPVAAAGLAVHEGVALLAGASTIPRARRQGAQAALLEARLRFAADTGCDVAMMCAEPGSTSQKNAERAGFRIAYTRVKWLLKTTAA